MALRHAIILLTFGMTTPAMAQNLIAALEACEHFATNHEVPDSVDTDFSLFSSTPIDGSFDTEHGEMRMRFETDGGANGTYIRCQMMGMDFEGSDSAINVTLTEGFAIAKGWMDTRAASTGGTVFAMGHEAALTICPEDGREIQIIAMAAFPHNSEDLGDGELPLYVTVTDYGTDLGPLCGG